jgi:phosphatidylglycerol:prolipoprotein diacylglycerol transferase
LGYVLFYHPSYYAASPLEVFAVWKGGMSSHGGFLGVGIAVILISRLKRIPLLPLLDLLVVPTAIGLALGRFGNFINQELYGIPTTLPWGIAIPGVEELRHPTQIYAIVKDLSIAVICFAHLRRTVSDSPGGTIVLGLLLYGVLRFLLEYLREQDVASLSIGFLSLTRGQLLTLPLIAVAVGIGLWRRLRVPPGGGS